MKMNPKKARHDLSNRAWKRTAVAAAVSLAIAESLHAQEAQQKQQDADQQQSDALSEVIVTATKRSESIQKIPFNISAIDGSQIAEKGLTGITDLLRETPGLFSADQGRGSASEIVARGLSLGGTSEPAFANNDVGGVVSTYLGEIPTFVDFRLTDLERVEVLLGPQGTLYGAGTLGGAVRYIPRKPQFASTELSLRGKTFTYAESDGVGGDGGVTVNVPLAENLAFRASVDYLHAPGFIDDNFIVRQPGVSLTQPDFSDPAAVAANLRRVKDANTEKTLSGHAALRFKPNDVVDATLNLYFQDQKVAAGGNNHVASFGTGSYESADRFLQFQNRRNRIASLEVTADLGFAELTSATGYTKYNGETFNDVTDLIMTLGYGYELFPSFAYYSPWTTHQSRLSQEVRLVSKNDGPLNWIAGGFFDRRSTFTNSPEYAPGIDQFILSHPEIYGATGGPRPDANTLANQNKLHQKEKAVFGELTYKLTDAWKIIGGARWYDYKQQTAQAFDLPLYYTVFEGRLPNDLVDLQWEDFNAHASGTLLKFSTSYEFTPDLMGFFTRSEGYRIGSANPYPSCTTGAHICVGPNETQYLPDTTINYELGLRSQWLDHRLTANGSLFYVDWKDPQLRGTTEIGGGGITTNGKGARSRGVDLSVTATVSRQLKIGANYSYTEAALTATAKNLIATIADPATNPADPFHTLRSDGLSGDRLPHSPKHQGSVYVRYMHPVTDQRQLVFNYGITAVSNVLTTVGGRGDGETLGGYAVHSASIALDSGHWTATLYADNLLNKYAVTSVEKNRNYIQTLTDVNGNPVPLRWYSSSFITPRQVGLNFTYDLGL